MVTSLEWIAKKKTCAVVVFIEGGDLYINSRLYIGTVCKE